MSREFTIGFGRKREKKKKEKHIPLTVLKLQDTKHTSGVRDTGYGDIKSFADRDLEGPSITLACATKGVRPQLSFSIPHNNSFEKGEMTGRKVR